MLMHRTPLGLIPAWQFSPDPAVNTHLNPNVVFPDGVTQVTPQPLGPYFSGDYQQLGYTNPFASAWWQNRKWIAAGVFGLVGVALIGGLGLILK